MPGRERADGEKGDHAEHLGLCRLPTGWHVQRSDDDSFFHPTHADVVLPDGRRVEWSAREHRKGYHARPRRSRRPHLPRLYARGDTRDVSWWVAVLFRSWPRRVSRALRRSVIGSCFWLANGIIVYSYYTWTTARAITSAAVTAFCGGTSFLIGSFLTYAEALNPSPTTSTEDDPAPTLGRQRRHFGRHTGGAHWHHHRLPAMQSTDRPDHSPAASEKGSRPSTLDHAPKWRWLVPTLNDLRSAGTIAAVLQAIGAVIFEISVIAGLPGVLPEDALAGGSVGARSTGLADGLYWGAQVLASPMFAIPGLIFMFEAQRKWYRPRPLNLGWHVGLWNFLGGLGFLLSGVFGLWKATNGQPYQRNGTALTTFLGSVAFMVGSIAQYLEAVDK